MAEPTDSRQSLIDVMDPARARALQAVLGLEPDIAAGDALPPFFHQVYFWEPAPTSALGRDGHERTGGVIPDLGLPRRIWAAGRLLFHAPLRAGIRAERITRLEAVTRKDGRSGPLGFVRLRHDIRQRGGLALTEWQEIVYRPEGAAPAEAPRAPVDESGGEALSFDPVTLFRYSALTFDAHRIHYDAPYAAQEGHGGLVVHGPLLAQHLMLLAEARLGGLGEVSYRATAPLMVEQDATCCWRPDGTLWVRAGDGRQVMIAEAR